MTTGEIRPRVVASRVAPSLVTWTNANDSVDLVCDLDSVMTMSSNVENLILARLDRIRDELAFVRTDIGEIKLDIRELRARMGQVEHAVSTLSIRFDRLTDRVERIELQLGLVDAPGHEAPPRPT